MLTMAEDIALVKTEKGGELRGLLRNACSQSLGQTALVGGDQLAAVGSSHHPVTFSRSKQPFSG